MREIWLSFKENFALLFGEIPLNEGNSVEIPPQGARREVNLTAVSKMQADDRNV